ncbi:MAG TPA: nucleoside hydrolase, partial [Thermoguttaceae bacterium]|nr:nucleoside hydrolase [Thermoguttaceae bacterium]
MLLTAFGVVLLCAAKASAGEAKVPVIYCSDLFHPHDDPDDHFDIASLYAIEEIDIKAVILDQGAKQERQPGAIPVGQVNQLTGRKVPFAIGLPQRLTHSADTGLDQPERYQGAVRLILTVLETSPVPVTIITVGSLRDVAAAHNRRPELFRTKVSRIFSFIGDAKGAFQEYNVSLDPHAYESVMNAELPLYWVPCFDGGLWKNEDGNASFWQASHAVLLRDASEPVLN